MNEMPKADVGTRFVAALIDGLISGVVSSVIPIVGAIASTAYMLVKDGLFEGQSVGKRVMKLQVLDTQGKKADYAVSAKRNVIFAIPTAIMIIPLLGWVIAPIVGLVILIIEVMKVLNEPDGRRLGDQWAGTQVVMYEQEATATATATATQQTPPTAETETEQQQDEQSEDQKD